MRELFESVGAFVLDGGSTLNPSTYELLAGIHEAPAEEVVVLPNSPNVVMAAERAAELSEKDVRVVASRSMQAGLAAAVALDPTVSCEANAAAMGEALAHVRTGSVTGAARDDAAEATPRFRAGEAVGFVEEELVAWGDVAKTLEAVLAELWREAELVTLIEGEGAPLAGEQVAGPGARRRRARVRARRPARLLVAHRRRVVRLRGSSWSACRRPPSPAPSRSTTTRCAPPARRATRGRRGSPRRWR